MAYNLTNLTNGGNLFSVFQVANEVTNGWFGLMIVLSTFLIALVSMMQVSDKKLAFASASFITFLITLMLRTTNLMNNDYVFFLVLVMLIVSVLVVHKN